MALGTHRPHVAKHCIWRERPKNRIPPLLTAWPGGAGCAVRVTSIAARRQRLRSGVKLRKPHAGYNGIQRPCRAVHQRAASRRWKLSIPVICQRYPFVSCSRTMANKSRTVAPESLFVQTGECRVSIKRQCGSGLEQPQMRAGLTMEIQWPSALSRSAPVRTCCAKLAPAAAAEIARPLHPRRHAMLPARAR
jgi:hypothetical protein